jgi:hypothetical protein
LIGKAFSLTSHQVSSRQPQQMSRRETGPW